MLNLSKVIGGYKFNMEAKSVENRTILFNRFNKKVINIILIIILILVLFYFLLLYKASNESIIDTSYNKVSIAPYDVEFLLISKELHPYLSSIGGIFHKPKQIVIRAREVIDDEGNLVFENDYRLLFIKTNKNTLLSNQSSVIDSTSFNRDDGGSWKLETDHLKDGYYTIIIQNLIEKTIIFEDLEIHTK